MMSRDYKSPLIVVYDAQRRHNYEEFKDVCETVQAHYGTGGVILLSLSHTMQEVTETEI